MKRYLLFFAVLGWCLACGPVQARMTAAEAEGQFRQAGAAYRDGRYAEAAALYEAVRGQGWESGPLYYNLANSYFKMGELGRAVLNYRRALRLIPRDSDLRANYRYTLSLTPAGRAAEGEGAGARFSRWLTYQMTLYEWAVLMLWCWLGGLGAHLLSLYLPSGRQWRGPVLMMLGCVFALCAGGGFLKYAADDQAAVAVARTEARYEPRPEATVYFDLGQGEEVRILKSAGGWVKVRRPDGKTGWAPRSDMDRI